LGALAPVHVENKHFMVNFRSLV